ncbi:DUF2959 domain-containing protein [Thaumasiovibrio subtropicus]|uniref:DUF2959 domain-containing protein n=1 Tax=Thaumasiovibrio subtropicus TaxID=1891207 RepID=UPI000B350C31|nr:DUF2959 domain-containing protein [Thaumasiovibrio subtropicus]
MRLVVSILVVWSILTGCSSTYYAAMEKVGVHKREIMVDRVASANEAQQDAQQQFTSALDALQQLTGQQTSDLQSWYQRISREYDASVDAADEVSERIDAIEHVAEALFDEWYEELSLYSDSALRRDSEAKLKQTEKNYGYMLEAMRRAEQTMQPILVTLLDNTLYLKHNLNAQAIDALEREFSSLERDIELAIKRMEIAINESNRFIAGLK